MPYSENGPSNLFTFLISAIISLGSLEEVVFMLQVNRSDLGFTSPPSFTALLQELLKEGLFNIEITKIEYSQYSRK